MIPATIRLGSSWKRDQFSGMCVPLTHFFLGRVMDFCRWIFTQKNLQKQQKTATLFGIEIHSRTPSSWPPLPIARAFRPSVASAQQCRMENLTSLLEGPYLQPKTQPSHLDLQPKKYRIKKWQKLGRKSLPDMMYEWCISAFSWNIFWCDLRLEGVFLVTFRCLKLETDWSGLPT